jgi:anti-sigma regulatory factor (Ser/Thr protein kinase)
VSLPFAGADPEYQTRVVTVADQSQIGEARRAVSALSMELGFDEHAAGRIAIVVTELATNIARHGRGGQLFVRRVDSNTGLEIIAVDKGPGIGNVERAIRDGYSTAGTPGKGLGAVRRLSDTFDIYSQPGKGTAVLAIMRGLRISNVASANPVLELGVICVPAPGERVCGDAWIVAAGKDGPSIVIVDGLGHGEPAHEAAIAGIEVCQRSAGASPGELISRMHQALRSTRGAAAAVAEWNGRAGMVRFAGAGNISCSISSANGSRSLASMNGTVGFEMRRVQEFAQSVDAGSMLVMHSDGVNTRWRLDQYPGLRERHPALAAALLYRDFVRGRDDATVVVARNAVPRESSPT